MKKVLGNWYRDNSNYYGFFQAKYFYLFGKMCMIGWAWNQWFKLSINKNYFSLSFFGYFIEIIL
jgi:hypothetical protein